MSKSDAEQVKRILENAQEAAKPLKDKELVRKIEEATKHVVRRIDPSEKTT